MQWNLYKLRKEKGETQKQLANLIGVSEESYRLKENGSNQFKSNEMFIIAQHFEKTMDEIFLPTKYTKSKQLA
ncbi:TPA: helix-turn-helix transcriptional regulator [Enterococcus faecalis]|uniref:helix-turn-helix transcriptional regulator n=1 Tax=Enterococcus faecalis TaxID=1351 RepID=UPI00032E308B|nr:helix-turn-helix transcriptional regulator [Enterococcus faecalis]EOJ14284.1 hypothetical protein UMM_00924 [Enterococcus faecalis EnGen0279]NSW11082.1 helix-turn-helix transcriptional regulator [Enterococcus faecalis]TQB28896.1 helix-turn-helix transcriptional regulator [Enterococcus faecalis]HDV0866324.1 helix-turn-helix transcriptional regulator [Enterococcus faecalis]HEL7507702.1 helix-turn-helix transcriptional regulator [Enterococcus faecalis]